MRKRITAADVAAATGVSTSTVSRVMNDVEAPFISAKTRLLVRTIAQEMGYTPNPLARALRLRRTHQLGLIVREIADPFFSEFIDSLSSQARDIGYQMILGHAHSDASEGLIMKEVLDARQTDGLFILGDLRDDEPALQEMIRSNPAVVALCRGTALSAVPTINVDNRTGIRLLLDYLYDLGHRCFALIDGGWLGDIRERQNVFLEFIIERDLTMRDEWIWRTTNDAEGGYHAMESLLSLATVPTAVLASDDVMAIGALKAASVRGVRVPRDVSVVGFDDISIARFVSPSLTTVRQPVEAMCSRALEIILGLIDQSLEVEEHLLIQLPPELIVRDSAGPPPITS
jgi:LacI family transcriptional regulator